MLYCVQSIMNTNTIKVTLLSLLVHTMCLTVVLSHIHAKDAVSMFSGQTMSRMAPSDITAKALGDLHHHIDKASLKNITTTTNATTSARVRELDPLSANIASDSLSTQVHDFLLRLRVVASLFYNLA